MHRKPLSSILLALLPSIALAASPVQERADRFLKLANAGYQALFRVNAEAQWTAITDVTPEHDAAAGATGKAYAAFNGNPAIITEARDLLTHENELTPITVRQFPGERATIADDRDTAGGATLQVNGACTDYWDFEVTNTAGNRGLHICDSQHFRPMGLQVEPPTR